MVIGVDIDDVVARLMPAWIARYNRRYQDNLSYTDITNWDMVPFVKPACGDKIYDLLTDDIYDHVEPVEGAGRGIDRILQAGHRVVYITAGSPRGPDALRKYQWLQDWSFLDDMTGHSPDFMVCFDKGLLNADLLIDDKVDNCQAFAANSGKAILFSQPHNAYCQPAPSSSIVRAKDWAEVLRLVLGIESDASASPIYNLPWVRPSIPLPMPDLAVGAVADGVKADVKVLYTSPTKGDTSRPLNGTDGPYWTVEDEAMYQHLVGGTIEIDGFPYQPFSNDLLDGAGLVETPGCAFRHYGGRWWQIADPIDDTEAEAAKKYVTGEMATIHGKVYEPWTAFWTLLPVAEDLVQEAGAVFYYYARHWWKRIDARPQAAPAPAQTGNNDIWKTGADAPLAVNKADHLLALPPMPEKLNELNLTQMVNLAIEGLGVELIGDDDDDDDEDFDNDDAPEPGLLLTGVKYDNGKTRFDLLPPYPLMELARLYTIGADKYADRNWEKGMPFGRVFSAMQRHAWKWWAGDEIDNETLVNHLTAVAWCAFTLLEYTATHTECDDRPYLDDGHVDDTLFAAQVKP